jgi:hypothetical protein
MATTKEQATPALLEAIERTREFVHWKKRMESDLIAQANVRFARVYGEARAAGIGACGKELDWWEGSKCGDMRNPESPYWPESTWAHCDDCDEVLDGLMGNMSGDAL